MGARFRSWWQQIKQHPYATGLVVLLEFIQFVFLAYRFGWDWTGFNSNKNQITITSSSNVNYTATLSQPSKSLWDWLQLLAVLAIPVVVGLGAAWYTVQQGKVSDRENKDNQRETALQAYIDKISKLLLHEHLGESAGNHQVETIARARTATVLRTLDPVRCGSLIRFLSQAGILVKCTEKDKAMAGLDLHGADLSGLNLFNTNLSTANLSGGYLSETDLRKAFLIRADLRGAFLWGADLREADLVGADLRKAFLSGAIVTDEQLEKAKSLKGTTMRDGTIHE